MAAFRLRDYLRTVLPLWLTDRLERGRTAGWRFCWGMVGGLDALLDVAAQGLGSWLGFNPTAVGHLGRGRGIIRGQNETSDEYATRLTLWLDTWPDAGSQELIAVAIHHYLASHPRVRVITREGLWLTVNADGSITRQTAAWDWDSVSHPERSDPDSPWWSDMWIVVQSPWAHRPGTMGDLSIDGYAWGHLATHEEVAALKGLMNQWKGAHSCIRAVIWTTDASLFDPASPGTCPNGRWGAWGIYDGSSYVPSDRNRTTCRYWEPR